MPSDRYTGLAAVLGAIRSSSDITQPMLVEQVGLGRSVVAQRVAELEAAGLVVSDGFGPSTGGRAPRRLRLNSGAGYVLGADIATNELVVGVADLSGALLDTRHREIDVVDGPDVVVALVEQLAGELVDGVGAGRSLWSFGVGMPGPVAYDDGGPAALPTMPEWTRHPTRRRLTDRFGVPVWMDNRTNLSALGERRVNPLAARSRHMVYLGGGYGIGAAVVVDGRIHRGAHGLAGAIDHLPVPGAADVACRCGRTGCLEAVAGGGALVRDGRLLAETGQSPALARVLERTGRIRPSDVTGAAGSGDAAARALLHRAATLLGRSLATLVTVFDPDLVVVGGGIARARAHVLAAIREEIYRSALPAATRDLRIEPSAFDQEIAGITGAVEFALGELFSPENLPTVLDARDRSGTVATLEEGLPA
ncbi:Sugar kinase of the NBD/HSP70 family, may contain an N-terminal HTH domain [Geodermatophilus saharensis]|uniref:Sugar kinase of the NBD/HSP70 family, may contain an N-terminal HTH domain n=1 Tax=Geodermatophilus saharensis TaxID=1137994 RepID=A0A239DNP9_9ACTN|nr:ROK family transcriptional regulator [Geodermatophilus saharensis]SNS33382.1 Sugar kinase of the NBD/HSP70 family, may contain an N-terminal HTH domain [Geodermatophilus saharensis]